MRLTGVLLPIFSLPSKYGIGTFSKEAFEFVDFLKKAGQHYWQILPLGPTGYGDSPYQSFSTFAGNPYFIDLQEFIEKGWLTEEEITSYRTISHPEYVEYDLIYASRFKLLRKAFTACRSEAYLDENPDYEQFCNENSFWLTDYALFMSIKEAQDGKCFVEWPEPLRLHEEAALSEFAKEHAEELDFYRFQQFFFRKQWTKLREYAHEQGIEFIGDIPIYVAFDSADAWSTPRLFQLNEDHLPVAVAGCPPDYFAAKGQLWGNPLYDWEYHKSTGYEWWMKRLRYQYTLYDVVRIDHFRGFESYYSIPYGDEDALGGHWEKGPGIDFFNCLKKTLNNPRVIAEDLGMLTQEVFDLVEETGYPGMKVLQFAFSAEGGSAYLPHNIIKNCVVYTGTHDNDTVWGWYHTMSPEDRKFLNDYLLIRDGDMVHEKLILTALTSVADLTIIPMQDYLSRDSETRINTPSTFGNNWKWRMPAGVLNDSIASWMNRLAVISERVSR